MSEQAFNNVGFNVALEVRHGATFPIELKVMQADGETPYDLTGHEVKASILSKPGVTPAIDIQFDFTGSVPGASGIVQGVLAAVDAATLVANDAKMMVPRYRWLCDIKTPTGEVIPFCRGDVYVRLGGIDWS